MKRASRPKPLRVTAVLVIALLFAACGGGSNGGTAASTSSSSAATLPPCPLDALANATAPVDVVVWHTQTARPLEVLTQLVDEYNNSQSKVRVHLESQGSSYTEIQRKFNEAVPSKQLPAILDVDDTFTKSMADSGVILPAQSCFNADNNDLSGLVPTARSYYTINGVLWPASAGVGTVLIYFNRNHFVQAGLDPNTPPTSLAEVRQFAEKLKAAGASDKPLAHEFASWKTSSGSRVRARRSSTTTTGAGPARRPRPPSRAIRRRSNCSPGSRTCRPPAC